MTPKNWLRTTAIVVASLLLAACQGLGVRAYDEMLAPSHVARVDFYLAQATPAPGLSEQHLPGGTVWLQGTPVLDRTDLTDAAALLDRQGRHYVGLRFSTEGSRRLNEISLRNIGKPLAIVIDGQLVAAPRIAEPLNRGVMAFTVDSAYTASDIAMRIRGD